MQDYILLNPMEYTENNIATNTSKYSKSITDIPQPLPQQNNNDIKLLDIISLCADKMNNLQKEIDKGKKYSKILKITVIILTILLLLFLYLFVNSYIFIKNKITV